MIKKLKISLLFVIFTFILAFNIASNYENSYITLSSFEVTEDKYFKFSNFDDENRTVSIAHNGVDFSHSTTLVLPDSINKDGIDYAVTEIASFGFYNVTSFDYIELPENLEKINSSAFRDCSNLTEIIFSGNSLTSIGDSAFDGCSSLEQLLLPEGLETIDSLGFSKCSSLELLYLPSTLEYVGNFAFTNCNNLKAIYLNSEIVFADSSVFSTSSCPIIVKTEFLSYYQNPVNLSRYDDITYVVDINIDYDGGNDTSSNSSGIVHKLFGFTFDYFVDEQTGIWNQNDTSIYSNLPEGLVKYINNQEFRLSTYKYNNNDITSDLIVTQELVETGITASYEGLFQTSYIDGVHTITGISESFKYDSYLDITIPSSYFDGINTGNVVSISDNAFINTNFFMLSFEEGVSLIGKNAFENCTFSNALVIPNSVSFIDDNAFLNAKFNPSYVYLNDSADYGVSVFDGVTATIIATNKENYELISNTIDNNNLTYLITVTFDFDGGIFNNENNLVLSRLYNTSLFNTQNENLSWSDDYSYSLPTPSKTDYLFKSYEYNNATVLINTIFTESSTINTIYDLQTVRSQNSDNTIEGNIFFSDGIDSDVTLEISINNNSSLSSKVSDYDVYSIYSINLLKNGSSYNPGLNSYKISILLPSDMEQVVQYTMYMNISNELVEVIGTYIDGYIVFEVEELSDIALLNEVLVTTLPSVNESVLIAIFVMCFVNIIEFAFIAKLNKGKRRTILASCNVLPLTILFAANNISLSILVALTATAIAQGIYILHLYLTRNNTVLIRKQVESIASSTVTLEELEDIINESRESIEELNQQYLNKEEYREILSLDDVEDEEVIEEIEEDENESDDEEVRTRLNSSGQMVVIRFKKSFTARLNLSEDINKDYHTIIKNKLLSYRKVNCRISWNYEAYNFGRNQAAKINVRGKSLFLYLPLDPKEYINSKISFKDCSYIKKYEQIPFRLKIKSKKSVKNALDLIELTMKNFNTSEKRKFEQINYYQKNRGFEKLLQEELIKEIITAKEYNELKQLNKVIEEDNDLTSNIKLSDEYASTRRNVMVKRTIFVEDSNNNIIPKNVMVRREANESTDVVQSRPLVRRQQFTAKERKPLVRSKAFGSTKEVKPLVRPKEAQKVVITSPFKLFEEREKKKQHVINNNADYTVLK